MSKEYIVQEIARLQVYLDKVKQNIEATIGELREFWKREEKRTEASIAKLK